MAVSFENSLESLEKQLVGLLGESLLQAGQGFGPESDLYESGLDSLSLMQLLVLVEKEFGVVIPDGDLTRENFRSVRQLARVVRQRGVQAA